MDEQQPTIALPVGKQIGVYQIDSLLGKGGMGTVYKVRGAAGEICALKMLNLQESVGREGWQRFLREIELLKGLRHPNIIRIHDSGEWQGSPYFVMDYLEGMTLAECLQQKQKLPERETLQIAYKIAQALAAVHQLGVLHRDIKPSNIFLVNKKPYLMDFGVSCHYTSSTRLTHTGAIVGTPNYMALEQAQGEIRRLGPWSDVYSLGATMYQMLSGVLPFKGKSDLDVLINLQKKTARPLRKYAPWVSEETARVVHKAMHKDYRQRHQTAEELAGDLHALLHEKKNSLGTTMARRLPRLRPSRLRFIAVGLLCVLVGMSIALLSQKLAQNAGENKHPEGTSKPVPDKPLPKPVPDKPLPKPVPDKPLPKPVPDKPLPKPVPDKPKVAGLRFPSPVELVMSGKQPELEQQLSVLQAAVEKERQNNNQAKVQELCRQLADIARQLSNNERELCFCKQIAAKDRALWLRMYDASRQMGLYSHTKYYHDRLQMALPESITWGIPANLPAQHRELRQLWRLLCCFRLAMEDRLYKEAEEYWQAARALASGATLAEFAPLLQALYVLWHVRTSDKNRLQQELRKAYQFPQQQPKFPICSVYWHLPNNQTFVWIGAELYLVEGIYNFFNKDYAGAQNRFDLLAKDYPLYASASNSRNDSILYVAKDYMQALKGTPQQKEALAREERMIFDVVQFLNLVVCRILGQGRMALQSGKVHAGVVQAEWEDVICAEIAWHHLFHMHLATTFYKPAGVWQPAIEHAWRARQSLPSDGYTDPIFVLAQIAFDTGYRDEASTCFRYCLEHPPAWSGDKKEILALIQQKLAELGE